MKKLYLGLLAVVILAAVVMLSCSNRKSVPEPIDSPIAEDSALVSDADTTALDTTEAAPPAAVDELFADFIYSYTTNRKFQYSRTKFPLKWCEGKKVKTVNRKAWKFNRLHFEDNLHLVILDSERSLRKLANFSSDTVKVECMQFVREYCRQYVFVRDSGRWLLSVVKNFPISRHRDADFMEFYGNFANDSVFQTEHLAETIDFITYDDENRNEKIEGIIEREQWPVFHPELPEGDVYSIDYGMRLKNSNVRVVSVRESSSGMSSMFKFVKHDGVWHLVKFEN